MEKTTIESVDIKFGYSCNNNCIHCVIAGHKERLLNEKKPIDRPTDEIKEHILDAKRKGAKSVVFTGGEVTIRPDFFELLEFAKTNRMRASLQTNGRSFCVKEFAGKTLGISPDMHFEVAIHSNSKDAHDKITRVEGSFSQTIQGIKNLIECGTKRVNFKVVISRLNFQDLEKIVALAHEVGVKQVDIAYPHGMGNARKHWFEIVPKYTEIYSSVIRAASFGREAGVKVTFEAIPFCFLNGFENCASELRYLEEYIKGTATELRQVDEPTINWQQERLRIKSKPIQCKECKYYAVCEGMWCEYLELYGGEEFKPVKGKKITSIFQIL